jgi:hypothetical protein
VLAASSTLSSMRRTSSRSSSDALVALLDLVFERADGLCGLMTGHGVFYPR